MNHLPPSDEHGARPVRPASRWLLAIVVAGCLAACSGEDPSATTAGSGASGPSSTSSQAGGSGGSGTTGAAGGGGAGAMGGGGSAASLPADWSSAMEAVYRFDDAGNLGLDSSNHHHDLLANGMPSQSSAEAMQGGGSLQTSDSALSELMSAGPVLDYTPTSSLTFGGWFRIDNDSFANHIPIRQMAYLERSTSGGPLAPFPRCIVPATPDSIETFPLAGDHFPLGEWKHFVCRLGQAAGTLALYDAGVVLDERSIAGNTPMAPGNLYLNRDLNPMDGFMDEVFIIGQELSDASIARIHACGIDGALCSCDAANTAMYTDCGRAQPNCNSLAPCDQLQP